MSISLKEARSIADATLEAISSQKDWEHIKDLVGRELDLTDGIIDQAVETLNNHDHNTAKNQIKQTTLEKIEIKYTDDESPDVSYLETTAEEHYGENGSNWSHVSEEEKAKVIAEFGSIYEACIAYAARDKERLDAFNRGEWHMIGIQAKATILIPIGNNSFSIQSIHSNSLWGIESDSDEKYLKEIEQEQIEEVKRYLKILNVKIE